VLSLKRRGTSQAGSQFFTTLFLNRYRHKFTKAALLFRNLVEEGHIPEMGRDTFSLRALLQFGLIVARTPLVFLETAPMFQRRNPPRGRGAMFFSSWSWRLISSAPQPREAKKLFTMRRD
jgi:hypothetical protein